MPHSAARRRFAAPAGAGGGLLSATPGRSRSRSSRCSTDRSASEWLPSARSARAAPPSGGFSRTPSCRPSPTRGPPRARAGAVSSGVTTARRPSPSPSPQRGPSPGGGRVPRLSLQEGAQSAAAGPQRGGRSAAGRAQPPVQEPALRTPSGSSPGTAAEQRVPLSPIQPQAQGRPGPRAKQPGQQTPQEQQPQQRPQLGTGAPCSSAGAGDTSCCSTGRCPTASARCFGSLVSSRDPQQAIAPGVWEHSLDAAHCGPRPAVLCGYSLPGSVDAESCSQPSGPPHCGLSVAQAAAALAQQQQQQQQQWAVRTAPRRRAPRSDSPPSTAPSCVPPPRLSTGSDRSVSIPGAASRAPSAGTSAPSAPRQRQRDPAPSQRGSPPLPRAAADPPAPRAEAPARVAGAARERAGAGGCASRASPAAASAPQSPPRPEPQPPAPAPLPEPRTAAPPATGRREGRQRSRTQPPPRLAAAEAGCGGLQAALAARRGTAAPCGGAGGARPRSLSAHPLPPGARRRVRRHVSRMLELQEGGVFCFPYYCQSLGAAARLGDSLLATPQRGALRSPSASGTPAGRSVTFALSPQATPGSAKRPRRKKGTPSKASPSPSGGLLRSLPGTARLAFCF
eukprot:TRINITY_DN8362_c1_g2_i1.p1 TRINITY_DN8362_c1_g2~~TRINITY_DN8362_c1_g2_i1.p1  ORF type:complete len:646 (+),score=113.43 TRINITY_DN8362_c1_g2_i1:73-1938(+)